MAPMSAEPNQTRVFAHSTQPPGRRWGLRALAALAVALIQACRKRC